MPHGVRTALLMSGAIIATFTGGSLAGMAANAQEAPLSQLAAPTPELPAIEIVTSGVSYIDDGLQLSETNKQAIDLSVREDQSARFAPLSAYAPTDESLERRALELELEAGGDLTGMPVDVSIAQRASFGASEGGDINRRSTGAEVRIGRALGDPRTGMSGSNSRIYVFAASDDEAVTWTPGSVTRGYAYQDDRVEIGDIQAGVTYERGPVQASLAYVEREVNYRSGQQSISNDENFAGVTLTMKR